MHASKTGVLAPFAALTGLALAACGDARAQVPEWKPAPAPLMTRWAKVVSPASVRPEYPRPLFQRKEWKSLNGLWEFAFDDRDEGRTAGWHSGKPLPERILVPFTYEAALSGIGKGKEIHERVWYRRTFDVPTAWSGRRVRLNFNASDWETTAWLNGKELGSHRGGYDPFTFDITDSLKSGGPQELVVAVYDPADPRRGAYQPKGKQLGSEGIWYTRTTGIWQTVWLEPVHPAGVEALGIRTDVDPVTRKGTLDVGFRAATGSNVEVILSRSGRRVAAGAAGGGSRETTVSTPVDRCELWSPENPVLYDVTLRVRKDGRVIDEVKSYCAFRKYDIRNGRLALNGKPYFLRGALDQGYWPDGILTPPTDAALRYDVEMTKRLGFNMSRKHVKVEDPRWYYWCDRLGLAVWQDMPSSHNLASAEARENFIREWTAAMRTTGSYPSVLHYIPFNEDWGHPEAFQDEIVRLTERLDPTRPITDASGWTQRSLTHVVDLHDYGNYLVRHAVQNPPKPKVIGEYGGIALPVRGHTWTQGWGYQTVRDPEGLLRRIRFQTSQLHQAAGLSGFVYTQLTDVEQELNGLLTYDRQQKADVKAVARIFEGKDVVDATAGFLRDWLVLGPIPAGTDLRSAQDNPANRAVLEQILMQPFPVETGVVPAQEGVTVNVGQKSYAWKRIHLNELAIDFHRLFGAQTDNAFVYAAATIEVPREMRDVTLYFSSDDAARVWLNGQEVHKIVRVRGVGLDDDVVPGLTLKAGKNVLLVKIAQGIGGWGVGARLEGPDGKTVTADR